MENSRSGNASRTFVFGVIEKVISIFFPFIIRTIIIYKLGNEYLGLNGLFTSILNLLSISELGISSAIAFCLYKPISENDDKTIGALMRLMRNIYKIIGAIILLLGLAVLPFLSKLISGTYPSSINLYILYLIYLLNTVAPYFLFSYRAVLIDACQKGAINHLINSSAELLKYVIQIIVLFVFTNYYVYIVFLPIFTIVASLATEFISIKKYPNIKLVGSVSREHITFIKKKVGILFAHSVAARLTTSVDNIIISAFLGLTIVARFDNYQYVYTAITGFLIIAYRAIKPIMANSYYVDGSDNKLAVYNSMRLFSFWASMFTSVCLFCLFQPFMTIWVGIENCLPFSNVVVIVLYFYSNAVRLYFANTYIDILGLWNKTLFRQILASIANLALDLILVRTLGVFGIILSSFVTNFIIALPLDVLIVTKELKWEKVSTSFFKLIISFALTVEMCIFTYRFIGFVQISGVLGLFVKGMLCLLIPNVLFVICFSGKKEFRFMMVRLKSLFIRGRKNA